MHSPHRHIPAAILVRNLGKHYGSGHWGLRHADLSFERGRMVALLGPNGAGKSTLIHMLAGAIQPTEGEIVPGDPAARTGWSSQRTTIDWYLNVLQNVELGGRLAGIPRKEVRERARVLLEQFQLADLATNDVSMLSGGQQQRVQIARTLMNDPDIMLLDEPTASLDVEAAGSVLESIRDRTRNGAMALISSHDLGLLEQYCDDVIFVLQGRIVAHDSMSNFMQRFTPGTTVRLQFELPVTAPIFAPLAAFNPTAMDDNPRGVEVDLPPDTALSDVIAAVGPLNRVMDASRTPVSLRSVYLHLTAEDQS